MLVSDDEKDNDEQIERYFENLLTSPELRALILGTLLPALLEKAKAGEAVADVILKAAEIALDTIAKKD
jgi:mannose/fructose/N-acetylgalactosamine-specific phosphotransferase system component IID